MEEGEEEDEFKCLKQDHRARRKKKEVGETPPTRTRWASAEQPSTHQVFGRELFQPLSQNSLKLIREDVKVYVLKDWVKSYVFKAVVNRDN